MNYELPTYPAIRFFMNWGTLIGALVALGLFAGAAAGVWACGLAWWLLVFAAAGAALVFGLFLVLVEVLRILSDTLIPR